MITEGITHDLLICDPISYPILYQIPHGNPDPNIFQIVLASFMGMIEFIFAQYSVSKGIHLNLNIAGTPAIDPLAVDLPLPRHLLLVMLKSYASITRAMESLACKKDLLPGPRYPSLTVAI